MNKMLLGLQDAMFVLCISLFRVKCPCCLDDKMLTTKEMQSEKISFKKLIIKTEILFIGRKLLIVSILKKYIKLER